MPFAHRSGDTRGTETPSELSICPGTFHRPGPTIRFWSLRLKAVLYRRAAKALQLDPARCRLVESHVRLAEKIARRDCRWGSEDPDDTRSDALWGLILAARAFQPERGTFGSYAAFSIEGAIRRGRQLRSGIPRPMWEQGDHPTLVSLNVPVGEGREELLDMLPAPSDAEDELVGRRTPTAPRTRMPGAAASLLPRSLAVGYRADHRMYPDAGLADRTRRSGEAA